MQTIRFCAKVHPRSAHYREGKDSMLCELSIDQIDDVYDCNDGTFWGLVDAISQNMYEGLKPCKNLYTKYTPSKAGAAKIRKLIKQWEANRA